MKKSNNEILKNAIELTGKWFNYGNSNLVLLNEIKSFNEKETIFYALVIDLDEVEISKSSKISNRVPYSIENEEIESMKIKAKDFEDVKEIIRDAIDRIYRKDNDLQAIIINLTFNHLIGKCFKIDNQYFLVSNITDSNPDCGYRDWETDRKSTRLNSSHSAKSRMPSSA